MSSILLRFMSIHILGEGLVDLVPTAPGALSPLVPALGGGPYNVAIASARLGAEVSFQSRLSTDAFGNALMAQLEHEGVNTTAVQRGNEPTTLAVTSLHADGSAAYTFYTEGTADRCITPQLVSADIACFGTLSLALEPGASRYGALLRDYANAGTLVALDPNIRPAFATDAHREFLLSLLDHVDLLKLSEEEVDFLGAGNLSRVPVVVITRGDEGIEANTPHGSFATGPYIVEVADTIGAGDTVMAALLTELDRRGVGKQGLFDVSCWDEILSFAARAAAITVSRRGANPPTRLEVES